MGGINKKLTCGFHFMSICQVSKRNWSWPKDIKNPPEGGNFLLWVVLDSNQRPLACQASALNQLS